MIEENNEQEKSALRTLRELAGLTRPQVKGFIGVSERRQADWESGEAMPSLGNFLALARLYKVSLKALAKSMRLDVSGIPDDEPPDDA
jgi:transcriptional regulator with XRE-family HTH domain